MPRGFVSPLEIKYFDGAGEAAFYGPKIDFQFKNLMGREETVSTIQVDYLVPGRFGLKFIDKDGSEKVPVCIHRAPLSTHERFMSFLIEYYGGAFPTWCAPVQVVTIPVGDSHLEYAEQLTKMMKKNCMRVEIDQSNNSFNKKIRTNTVKKTPIILIVGDKEVAENRVTVRRYGINEQSNMTREEFLSEVSEEIRTRKMLREPMSNLL